MQRSPYERGRRQGRREIPAGSGRYGSNRYSEYAYSNRTQRSADHRPGSQRQAYHRSPEPDQPFRDLVLKFRRRPVPLYLVITTDFLVFAFLMLTFALFHHVIPRNEEIVGLTASVLIAAPAPVSVPAYTEADTQGENISSSDNNLYSDSDISEEDTDFFTEPVGTGAAETETGDMHNTFGDFSAKYAGHFSTGKVTMTEKGYRSANMEITCEEVTTVNFKYYYTDIYIRRIDCLQTVFAEDKFGQHFSEWPVDIANRVNAILAVNGDYYGARPDGIVIRNGMLYRKDSYPLRDLCVLYYDGVMETLDSGFFDAADAIERGAYQCWNFGPRLLDDNGQPMTEFNSDVQKRNPRTVIGYYEPGHYCLVAVGKNEKDGANLTELSQLMYDLKCKAAYNLDGGHTSMMVYGGTVVNHPVAGGRQCSDIIALIEP